MRLVRLLRWNLNNLPVTSIPFKFTCKNSSQKLMMDILLKYSHMTLTDLTLLLNLSKDKIEAVYQGKSYFIAENADNLALLFFMFFSG